MFNILNNLLNILQHVKAHFKKTLTRQAEARNYFPCAAQNLAMIKSLTVVLQMTVTITVKNQKNSPNSGLLVKRKPSKQGERVLHNRMLKRFPSPSKVECYYQNCFGQKCSVILDTLPVM